MIEISTHMPNLAAPKKTITTIHWIRLPAEVDEMSITRPRFSAAANMLNATRVVRRSNTLMIRSASLRSTLNRLPRSARSSSRAPVQGRALINSPQLDSHFDIIVENTSPGDDPLAAAAKVRPWIEAGATWWIESMWGEKEPEKWRQRIRQGPPKL